MWVQWESSPSRVSWTCQNLLTCEFRLPYLVPTPNNTPTPGNTPRFSESKRIWYTLSVVTLPSMFSFISSLFYVLFVWLLTIGSCQSLSSIFLVSALSISSSLLPLNRSFSAPPYGLPAWIASRRSARMSILNYPVEIPQLPRRHPFPCRTPLPRRNLIVRRIVLTCMVPIESANHNFPIYLRKRQSKCTTTD